MYSGKIAVPPGGGGFSTIIITIRKALIASLLDRNGNN
jgi:hypothetical protein